MTGEIFLASIYTYTYIVNYRTFNSKWLSYFSLQGIVITFEWFFAGTISQSLEMCTKHSKTSKNIDTEVQQKVWQIWGIFTNFLDTRWFGTRYHTLIRELIICNGIIILKVQQNQISKGQYEKLNQDFI